MAGTNEFALFRCRSIRAGGGGVVQNRAEINSNNAFRLVPVRKSAFPELSHFIYLVLVF